MKPAGRLQGAIDILRAILLDKTSPEKAILIWGRAHRFAGSSDRRAIQDTVYDVLRYYGSLSYYMDSTEPSHLVAGWLFFIKHQSKTFIKSLFCGERHCPKALPLDVLRHLKPREIHLSDDEASEKISDNFEANFNMNKTLEAAFSESLGTKRDQILQSLIPRAPLDMRVNLAHITRDKALTMLQEAFPETEFTTKDHIPTLIRCYDHINITQTDLYQSGKLEIQDGAAQYASALLVKYYMDHHLNGRILDFCAGGGGKALAIADMLHNKPEIIASDISETRLKSLKDRAKRAENNTIRIIAAHRLSPKRGLFDIVLVDSPCSGSGSWRRNIYEKWTTTPEKIQEYATLQRDILEKSQQFVSENGLLVYMTCSLFKHENDDVIESFLKNNPSFEKVAFPENIFGDITPYGIALNPACHDTDGFYISFLRSKNKYRSIIK